MRWNTTCSLADFADERLRSAIATIVPGRSATDPDYPTGKEHRKEWESAMAYLALRDFGVLHPSSEVLSVAGGSEDVAFHLTNETRRVFLTDIYGEGQWGDSIASGSMLVDPAAHVNKLVGEWNPRRLVVQHMDARELRFEDGVFDGVWSLSSIEHMGGVAGAKQAVSEQLRVTRRGGVVVAVTECVVDGSPGFYSEGLSFFTPEDLQEICDSPLGELVEPFDVAEPAFDPELVIDLPSEVERAQKGIGHTLPHLYLTMEGRIFTSACVVLRRR